MTLSPPAVDIVQWAVQRETVADLLGLPLYHPTIEELLQSALKDGAAQLAALRAAIRENSMNNEQIRILLHAPSATALERARNNASHLSRSAALDQADPATDPATLVCANTLQKIGRTAPAPLTILDEGAVLAIARIQREGWCYVRA